MCRRDSPHTPRRTTRKAVWSELEGAKEVRGGSAEWSEKFMWGQTPSPGR